jgi:type IV secretory pathway VirB10-like protein
MTATTASPLPARPGVVRLRARRIVGVLVVLAVLGGAAALWLLSRYAKPMTVRPVETTINPSWTKDPPSYATKEPLLPVVAAAPPPDHTAEILREQVAIREKLFRQQEELDALKRRPVPAATPATPRAVVKPPPPQPMLVISHEAELAKTEAASAAAAAAAAEYTLAPGATKLPCQIETAMNSDVEGYFTAKVSTNVYDTATGRHLLVPQGSTILGNDQSSQLVYGNERMDTISLKLALPDGRTVELGKAPVTDEQGVAGLTGDVNQHYLRLLAAVLIQGALRGGTTAITTATSQAAGAGDVASGIASAGSQAGTRVTGPMLNTRPTIKVAAGQLCNVLLLEPLKLPAMWQNGEPGEAKAASPPLATRR